jgi:signal transduction histidine kinase
MNLIKLSASRLDAILNDFLELGRLTQSHVKKASLFIEPLIHEILKSLEYLPEFAKIDFKLDIDQPTPIKSKKILLKAIIQNLIDNAVKYRNLEINNPQVTIKVREVDSEYEITVSDNGIGMTKSIQDNIFKMFYRGHDVNEGTGLGLYIVKSSVDSLRGKISVKSKPNKGTTFTILLPIK